MPFENLSCGDRLIAPGDVLVPSAGIARVWNRSNVCEEAVVLEQMYDNDRMLVVSVNVAVDNGYVLVLAKGSLGYVSTDRVIHAA